MKPIRFSIRGLMVAVVIVGFDIAAMTQANRQVRAGHAGIEVVYGFGLVLLFLHFVGFGLYRYFASFARAWGSPASSRLTATPHPLVIFGLYGAVLAIAILSALFFTSGRF
jgi:hypothetical protein